MKTKAIVALGVCLLAVGCVTEPATKRSISSTKTTSQRLDEPFIRQPFS